MLYPMAVMTYSGLVSQVCPFNTVKDCKRPVKLAVIYNHNANPKYGGFKRALFGHLSLPIITGSISICIKKCWYLCKASGGKLAYDNHTQITELSMEINCLHWASGLMGIIYNSVDKHIKMCGPPSFLILEMCFVKSALAIIDTTHEMYMIEEVIDEVVDGVFMKYIGNGSAKPFDFLSGDAAHQIL